MAVFSRAFFQVAKRVATGNLVKTVNFPTRLKLSESANFNRILIGVEISLKHSSLYNNIVKSLTIVI